MQMDSNYNTGISIRKYGAAFAWEIALVIACHRSFDPPIKNDEDLHARWKELFPSCPAEMTAKLG